jgi:NAD(P)-dependent dehydrogenase (short-subunit alcohol dehydrogenase family)
MVTMARMLDERVGLRGRTVVVAGAGGGGIGTGVSTLVAESGAHVLAIDIDEGNLAITTDALDAAGARSLGVIADVSDRAGVEAALDHASGLGPLHGLVHVAGGLMTGEWSSLLELDDDRFDAVVRRNLHSAFVTSSAVARRLVEQGSGGSIVHVASIVASSAMPFGAPYAAAKAGLLSLTRTAALEWASAGIRVNAVAAGTVRTRRNLAASAPEGSAEDAAGIPLGRRGLPADVAGTAVFLLSDLAAFVTGQVVAVDGGASVRPSFLDDDGLPRAVRDDALRARLTCHGGSGSSG